jgi:hypothetical protein
MDFILQKINQRIGLLQMTDDSGAMAVHYRSRIEYLLTLMLGFLWNKNFSLLDSNEKMEVFNYIIKPTIGDIVSVCKTLDVQKEIFSVKSISKSIDKYPDLRNTMMGHGFTFEDASEDSNKSFVELYNALVAERDSLFGMEKDFVNVQKQEGSLYKGVLYAANGEIRPWSCPRQKVELKIEEIYIYQQDHYFSVSPFIKIENTGDNIYIYGKITEKLLGKIRYNRLVNTGAVDEVWEPFSNLCVINDGVKVKTANGTIRNIYENNYTTYIDVGVKSQILNFLKNNKSSVCATLWGHGGIGKTATIQYVCDYLSNKEYKLFDYIVFISAKDRRYNYYNGIIEDINSGISTYADVIRTLNQVLFDKDTTSDVEVLNYEGSMLVVLDDFESFAKEEARLLSDFILRMDINHHKVVVTTRSANVALGFEIKTNELDVEQTNNFLQTFIANEGIPLSIDDQNLLRKETTKRRVHEITSGRPLFIYQLGHIIGQNGLLKALNKDIKKGDSAVEFLYGRIYDYLSPKAKDLFVVMSLLVTKDDMTNVLDKAQYIINMENDDEGFNSAVEELKKLKIVKITDEENRYFEIYSREILEMMNKHFVQRDASFVGSSNMRCAQVNKDKNADIEHSLLNSANSGRLVKSEIETVESFKQILNRSTSPLDVKMSAVFSLSNYLLVDRGKRAEALDIFDKYSHFFTGIAFGKEGRIYYANYAFRWATTYWANGTEQQKRKAITILSDYYKGQVDFHDNLDIEIASTLLMYRSIIVLKEWRELKDKNQFNEISYSEYRNIREEQIKECKGLLTYIGNPLYSNVAQRKLDFPSGTRQSLITAFFNYVDVLLRINKKDLAIEICDYVILYGPKNFVPQFESKRNWMKSIQ